MTTYVYEGQEVRQTGRTASRKINLPGGKVRESLLVEITPVDVDDGWKKWVAPEQLFTVTAEGDLP